MFKHLATLGVLMFCAFAIWGEAEEGSQPAQVVGAASAAPELLAPRRAVPEPETIQVARAAPPPTSFDVTPRLVGEPTMVSLIAPMDPAVAENDQPIEAPEVSGAILDDVIPRDQFRVTGTRVNVRSGPSTANNVLGTVALDDIVERTGPSQGGWVEIENIETGLIGYMSSRFLEEL